jgi:DNA-binding winged helix-turn-helix (wHTH) protein
MTAPEPDTILMFAGYRLDARKRRLLAPDGTPISLASRAFDTLYCLASHPHELIDKQRLMQAVWHDTVVEENNLNQQISALRKILGDAADNPRFIVTDARRGFRFIQDVRRLDTRNAAAESDRSDRRKWRAPWQAIAGATAALLIMGAMLSSVPADRPSRSTPSIAASAGGTRNLEAYEAYLAAQAVTNNVGFSEARDAIRLLERAVQLDPSFAMAWAALAEAYTFAADFPASLALPLTPVQLQQRMSRAALRALELAPDAPQSLRSAGMVSMRNRDWIDAERRLRRAVELAGPYDYESNLLYAWFLMNVGRVTEAIPYEERAVRAEPLLLRPVTLRAALHEMHGEVEEAAALVLASKRLRGQEILRRQELIMICLARAERSDLMRTATMPGAGRACPSPSLEQLRDRYQQAVSSGSLGQLLPVVLLAPHLGDPALAMKALRAIGPTTQNLFAVWRPALREVRRRPEFQEFVHDVGLADYWHTSGHWGEFCHESDQGLVCS